MERSARLFLCARCRDQVLLCSHCDRGQQYCSRACSRLSRREQRRQAAQRYQNSYAGRLKHAARSARWRQRRRLLQCAAGDEFHKVTHQGCPQPEPDAPLQACPPFVARVVLFTALACRRCQHGLLVHVRQGYLRSNWRRRHDHPS